MKGNYYISNIKHIIYIVFLLFSIQGLAQENQAVRNDILALEEMGNRYYEEGKYSISEKSFLAAIEKAQEIDDLNLEIKITGNYTGKFINIRSLAKSIEMVLELKERTVAEHNDTLLFKVYGMIAQQYGTLGENISTRKEIADSMLIIAQNIGDTNMLRRAYFSLGTATDGMEAIESYKECLSYAEWEKDKKFISSVYNNMSLRYRAINELDKALSYADSAYIASFETDRLEGMAAARYRAAEAYYFKGEFKKSVKYGKEALAIFQKAGILRRQNSSAHVVSAAYKELGNYKESLKYFEMKSNLTDSMLKLNQNREAEFVGRKFQYELTQKRDSTVLAQERSLNALELENLNNKLSKERMQKYLLFGGIAMVFGFALFIWIGFQRKRKANLLIAQQKQLVEEKNEEIMDSIAYAKRIQSAILPPAKLVKEYLKESFILYKPKDVVAGDFYWMESVAPTGKNKSTKVLFAAADCTGHGVPGAMVSVVCNNALNRSVREHGLTDPGKILDKTREIVIQEFEKSEEEVKDGMDIAICTLEGNKLQYAGAHNPLWIIRNGEIIETKANKQPIGQFDHPEPYVTHSFELKKGDGLYIFSDGYVDQFGGEKGKKFKANAFRELLLSIQGKTMEDQKTIMDNTFETWKGALEQIDDVCVIGVRV